ncbi:hypothetical protein M9979_12120 [Sphingomonas sp. RP10(2022)]|uniref:Uncharacterized protein n=1 Tax=Sphingomonas liriopis TaxID=2949094 RepID=A0A9X2HY99_9SPHN|nr:hypothetical protein [Sphingomonas liriopis]MCP3735619.1 hypothetical protein [Sphingomonas liriopis]
MSRLQGSSFGVQNEAQDSNNRLRQRLDEGDRARSRAKREDVVIEDPRRLFLRSPNGTYFGITVSDAGVLTATNMGSNPL